MTDMFVAKFRTETMHSGRASTTLLATSLLLFFMLVASSLTFPLLAALR